ncbi:unnamed protein product, partial [marine sediment metagenome]
VLGLNTQKDILGYLLFSFYSLKLGLVVKVFNINIQ